MKTNYHTHSLWSDGKYQPIVYIREAIKKGFDILGFSDHSPVPFKSYWNMKYENLVAYFDDIRKLKKEYEGKLKIFTGIEADFIDGYAKVNYYKDLGAEYIIGGVHFLPVRFDDGRIFNIDDTPKLFEEGLQKIYNGDIKKFVKDYYEAVIKMVLTDTPDVVAHLDLVEKFNKGNKYFNSAEKWYQKLVDETLEVIKQKDCILELNSRSKYKKLLDDFNPKRDIVLKAKKLNIPFTISGDVHKPEEFGYFWKYSVKSLISAGYKEFMIFDEQGWHLVELTEN